MTPSIRQFLLVNLLLSITITTTLTAIGNYFLDQQDIERHLDALLAQTTISFQALISDDLHMRNLKRLQTNIDKVPSQSVKLFNDVGKAHPQYPYKEKFQFQVWSKTDSLLLHSPNAPKVPLSDGTTGFSLKYIDHVPWRIFTSHDEDSGAYIVVAEQYDLRSELAHKIARDDIYIMLLVYPLLGLLIWVVIGRGLRSITEIANQVKDRVPTYLEPVDIETVPKEIKPLIDELNKMLSRLQQGFYREKRFASDAAHELRTPLAALKTHVQIAKRATDPADKDEALKHVLIGIDRATHVVAQLLTLSRMHPEVAALEDMVPVELQKLAQQMVADLAPEAVAKKIDIELIAPKDNLCIEGNATALSILIRNLVENAIRYSGNNSTVKISLSAAPDTVTLCVLDNGPGIPAELRSRVFERFFRVLGSKVSGSGLGLAIVKQIVELHHAQITLGSGPHNRGLKIEVAFPRVHYTHTKKST